VGNKAGIDNISIYGIFTNMSWQVNIKKSVVKELPKLPQEVRNALKFLMADMEPGGPVRGNWQNYGKLSAKRHHCHIKKGRPTYVAVWEEKEDSIHLIEVTYAGTHEKAPY